MLEVTFVDRLNEKSVIDMIHVINYICIYRLVANMLNETCGLFSLLSEKFDFINIF